MLFAECVSGWRGEGSFAFMGGAQRSWAFIFSLTQAAFITPLRNFFNNKIIHSGHQIWWSRDHSWALFAGQGVQRDLMVAFGPFGHLEQAVLRELRTKSAEETFVPLGLVESFVLISFPHKCLFSCLFCGQAPNDSRGQWSLKKQHQCTFLLFLWSDASYWPPLSPVLIRKLSNWYKMASKKASGPTYLSHQSQNPHICLELICGVYF